MLSPSDVEMKAWLMILNNVRHQRIIVVLLPPQITIEMLYPAGKTEPRERKRERNERNINWGMSVVNRSAFVYWKWLFVQISSLMMFPLVTKTLWPLIILIDLAPTSAPACGNIVMLMGAAWKCAHMIVEATTQRRFPTSTTQFCWKAMHLKRWILFTAGSFQWQIQNVSCLLFIHLHSSYWLWLLLSLLANNLNDSHNQIKYHLQKKPNDTRRSVTERTSMSCQKEINITPMSSLAQILNRWKATTLH